MIDKKCFEESFISQQIEKFPKVDKTKMEMTIYAFGLLDALIQCKLNLIFKGGTSLLLLLDNPQRVSTDIDIIVPKKEDFDKTFDLVKEKFPFYQGEERGKTPNHFFRHFYFYFVGAYTKKPSVINLDVTFENNPYPKTQIKEVDLPFLNMTGNKTYVNIPSYESILGDKLTAFAPTTIGVKPFETSLGNPIDNRLQVIKQFYDIARLFDFVKNIKDVLKSYKKCHEFENEFRHTNYSIKETLFDTFNHAAEIASMGLWNKKSNFYNDVAKAGIQGISTNIFDGKYKQTNAAQDATKIMYLVSCLLTNADFLLDFKSTFQTKELNCFKAINDKKAFLFVRKSLELLKKKGII